MLKRNLIAVITLVCALPGIYALNALALGDRFMDVKMLAVATLVFRLGAGVIGALLLFKGIRLGAVLAVAMWGFLISLNAYAAVSMLTGPWQFEWAWNAQNQFYIPAFSQSIGYIALGAVVTILLIRSKQTLQQAQISFSQKNI